MYWQPLSTRVVLLIPYVGKIGAACLSVLFMAGFMHACSVIRQGQELTVRQLFAGFISQNIAHLCIVALGYIVGTLIIALLAMVLDFILPTSMALALALLSLIPFLMAYWLAPALIIENHQTAVRAMRLSFLGCWHNLKPLVFNGLLWLGLAIALSVLMAGISYVLPMRIEQTVLLLLCFVLMPLVYTNAYAVYEAVFVVEDERQ